MHVPAHAARGGFLRGARGVGSLGGDGVGALGRGESQSRRLRGAGDGVGRLAGVSLALLRLNLGKFTFGMVFRAVDVS